MSTRKHGKKRKAVEDEDLLDPDMEPQALIDLIQTKVQEKLAGQSPHPASEDIDLHHLIRTVRALLATNKEIWERLKPNSHKRISSAPSSHLTFERIFFPIIQVETATSGTHNLLSFKAEAKNEMKSFKVMEPPPVNLMRLVASPTTTKYGLEIYKHVFLGSLVLHKDVLIPFLLSLKEHLEATQVDLGKIEEWMMQPSDMATFIEKHFDKKLELRHVDHGGVDFTGYSWGPDNSNFYSEEKYTDFDSSLSESAAKRLRIRANKALSQRGRVETLKECQVSGQIVQTFDIREQDDQNRIVAFLGCLSCL